MTKFEKIIATILTLGIIISLIAFGYHIGKDSAQRKVFSYSYYDEYNCALAQRDRLADYLHIYMDMQDNETSQMKLQELVENLEKEDNKDPKCPPMSITDWCYAY